MKFFFIAISCFFLLSWNFNAFAQLSVNDGVLLGITPQQLVQNWLVGSNVTISNVTYNGSDSLIVDSQIGTFSALDSARAQLGLDSGIIMTCGQASFAVGPNRSCGKGLDTGGPGDGDLDQLIGVYRGTHDRAVIEFDFYPLYDTLKFNYVFSSEEFYVYCNSPYNDCFGFFLSGPGINGPFSNNAVNIAMMPGGKKYVTINNLCDDTTSNWCNAPDTCIRTNPVPPCLSCALCNHPRGNGKFIQYNGLTYVFTAWYIVQPCQLYHIKLAVADAGDHILDSGVFLEKNSFSTYGLQVYNTFTIPELNLGAIEGCNDAIVNFKLLNPTVNADTINFVVGGSAVNGIDYAPVGNYVIVPAGSDSTALVIHPYMDGITEGIETAVIIAQMPGCTQFITYYDTVRIFDNTPLTITTVNDTMICSGDTITLHALLSGGQTPYYFLWNTGSTLQNITVYNPQGTYSYSVTGSDICTATATDTIVLTVILPPDVTNVQQIYQECSGAPTNIMLQSNVSGCLFTWTVTCSSPDISGYFPDSGPAIIQTLFNSGITPDTVFYYVHATFNDCVGPVSVIKVLVIPVPGVTFLPPGETICSGQATNILLNSNSPGATFTWTFTTGSPNITGPANGNDSIISQVLFNNGLAIDSVIYHVVPIVSGCQGNVHDVIVKVKPLPSIINTVLTDTICNNSPVSVILSSSINPALFSWTAACNSPAVSGYGPGSGPMISQVLQNSGTKVDTVIYRVTPSADGCNGQPADFRMISCPVPDVSLAPQSQGICSGTQTNITISSQVNGTLFEWTASGSSPDITGYSGGFGNHIGQLLFNSGTGPGTVTYSVTPWILGCPGNTGNHVITVNPLPRVTFIPCFDTIISANAKPFKLKGGIPLGGSYSGPGVNPATGIWNPASAGTGTITITYSYTNVTLCSATAHAHIINFPLSLFICDNPFTDIRDNQVYQTVRIGAQCWMAENLNWGTMIPGSMNQRDNCFVEKYCYNDLTVDCGLRTYYQWDELMQYDDTPAVQGLCPPGWHIPTEIDWQILFNVFNGNGFAGNDLLMTGFSGFNAVVNGSRFDNASWNFSNFATHLWSSTSWGPLKAWAHAMNNVPDDHSVSTYPSSRSNAFSVRCILD